MTRTNERIGASTDENSAAKLSSTILVAFMLLNVFFIVANEGVSADQGGDYTYSVGGNPAVATITRYTGPGGAITIPSMLGGYETSIIDDDAFSWCPSLTSVVVPDTVAVIGNAAFYRCSYLTSVTIGSGVWNISYGAFYACTRLTSISFMGSVAPTEVGEDWIAYIDSEVMGHAFAYSDFPPPGGIFHNLTMGAVIPVPSVPGAPTALAAAEGAGFVQLNWTAPMDPGYPPLTDYQVYRGTRSGIYAGPIADLPPGTLGFNDTAVRAGVSYFYIVRAINPVGPGMLSNQVVGTADALAGAPSAPRMLSASVGDALVGITWEAPSSEGTSPVTSYRVYRGTSSGAESLLASLGSVLSYIDDGLPIGQIDFYQVSAVNDEGESPPSNEASATSATVPSAPQDLQATSGDSMIGLSWTAPLYAGPGMLTYHLFRNGVSVWNGNALDFSDMNVSYFVNYSYQVAADNSIGWGANSTAIIVTLWPSEMRPTAPEDLVAVAGNEKVDLTWSPPQYTNASGITSYRISYGQEFGFLPNQVEVNRSACLIGGLQKGQQYFFNVAAENEAGWSADSITVFATPFGMPSAPTGLTADCHELRIELNWSAPSYPGPGALNYHLFRNGSLLWSGSSQTFNDSTAFDQFIYNYQVAAENEVGLGPKSGSILASIAAPVVASMPSNFQISTGNSFANLTWEHPVTSGSAPVTSYKIYRGTNASSLTLLTNVELGTSYNDTAVTNGQTYYYQVRAVSSIGDGQDSGVLGAIPQAPITPVSSSDTSIYLAFGGIVVAVALAALFMLRRRG